MRRTRIKFCGMTAPADIAAAVALGVDALGFIFAPSPRRISPEDASRLAQAIPPLVTRVGVFADPDDALYREAATAMPGMLPQFCGDESPERCAELTGGGLYAKVIHVAPDGTIPLSPTILAAYNGLLIFDTKHGDRAGGSGRSFAWERLPDLARPIVVAGGLRPDTVGACIAATRPYAVDVRSGIECDGRKSFDLMSAFVIAVRAADHLSPR